MIITITSAFSIKKVFLKYQQISGISAFFFNEKKISMQCSNIVTDIIFMPF